MSDGSTTKPGPAYAGDEPFVFISYAHADEVEVFPEVCWLQSHDLNVWWDEGIGGGSRWRDEIAGRISDCHVLLFYVSSQSVQSSVCREELEYALAHDRPVLLVHLSDTELPDGIKLAASNRQALFRYQLVAGDYERKLLGAVTQFLGQAAREPQSRITRPVQIGRLVRNLVSSFVVLLVAAVAFTWWLVKPDAPTPRPAAHFLQLAPSSFTSPGSTHLTINGAGTHIFAILGGMWPERQVFVRPLDGLTFEPVPETKLDAQLFGVMPSYDGTMLMLAMGDGKLARMAATGGELMPLTTSRNNAFAFHARWSGPQTVLLQDAQDIVEVTWRDGNVQRKTIIEGGVHPFGLPDGQHVLYARVPRSEGKTVREVVIHNLSTGEESALVDGSDPRLTPSGHLLYFLNGAVWAVRFDVSQSAILGPPVKVLDNVVSALGKAQYEFADTGTMVYTRPFKAQMGLYWLSREGLERNINLPRRHINHMGLSPDEKSVAMTGSPEVQVFTFDDELMTRVATVQGGTVSPIWLDGGKSIVFTSFGLKNSQVQMVDIASNQLTTLLQNDRAVRASDHLADTNQLLIELCDAFTVNCDIATLDLGGSGDVVTILGSESNELSASLSPDGTHMVYASNEFGPFRIVIRPYPDVLSSYRQIPLDNCNLAKWAKSGRELFIDCASGNYAVPIMPGPELTIGEPRLLFSLPGNYFLEEYSEARGQFLSVKQENANNLFVVVLNWFDELNRLTASQ